MSEIAEKIYEAVEKLPVWSDEQLRTEAAAIIYSHYLTGNLEAKASVLAANITRRLNQGR
jgi:hypothetical protein